MSTHPTTATVVWKARSVLPPAGRRAARRIADAALSPLGSICGAGREVPRVALTFDDGPDASVTPALLELLRARGARATFFVVTDKAQTNRELIKRMVADGHEVALHCDRHDRLTTVPVRELRRRLRDARMALESITGERVRYFRPPFGAQSLGTFLAARGCGLEVVVWGPHAEDWVDKPVEAIAARGLAALRAGDVLLLHDGLEVLDGEPLPTFDRIHAFTLILDGIATRGLHATTVGDLVRSSKPRRTAWFRP